MIKNQNYELKKLVKYCLDNFDTIFKYYHLRIDRVSSTSSITNFLDAHPNFTWIIYLDDWKIYPNPLKLIYLASLVNVTITKNNLPEIIRNAMTKLNIHENDRLRGTFDNIGYNLGSYAIEVIGKISPNIQSVDSGGDDFCYIITTDIIPADFAHCLVYISEREDLFRSRIYDGGYKGFLRKKKQIGIIPEFIKEKLLLFEVKAGNIRVSDPKSMSHRIKISGRRSILNFIQKIGSQHPEKQQRFKKMAEVIQTYYN